MNNKHPYLCKIIKILSILVYIATLMYLTHCYIIWKNPFIEITSLFTKKTAYFTAWEEDAVLAHPFLKKMATTLQTEEYGNYKLKTHLDRTFLLNKQNLNIIAWYNFNIPHKDSKKQSYLIQIESPFSAPLSQLNEFKEHFNKIFTYHKSSCNDKQIIYIPIPYNYPHVTNHYSLEHKNTLTTLVNTYAYTEHNYYLRPKIVQWFLTNHPQDIVFYGSKWENFKTELPTELHNAFDNQYKGYVKDKFKAVEKSKFSFALENERFQDYVTEKIYDVMAAGSVPIYSGAPNITDYVPQECFIDYHAFQNLDELYNFLKTMSDDTYNQYLSCIQNVMKDPLKNENHYKNVAEKILSYIKE